MNNKNRLAILLASASLLAACATAPQTAVAPAAPPAAATPAPSEPAPGSALVQEVAIPHTSFKLANGLTVIVHEDHKAPIVAVSTWYNVGSKDEPKGKTGFAHLFEHLMFEGSEHSPESYFGPLQDAGAAVNGSTSPDRTNYWETVPRGALERALWLEADRMGWLLPVLTEARFNTQREVVLNERRESYENRPYGLAQFAIMDALFPAAHPYHWPTIGEPADLAAATLADVHAFFSRYYHPGNASLAARRYSRRCRLVCSGVCSMGNTSTKRKSCSLSASSDIEASMRRSSNHAGENRSGPRHSLRAKSSRPYA